MVSGAQTADSPTKFIKDFDKYTPQESAMISMYKNTKPLETSLGQEVGKRTTQAFSTVDKYLEYPFGMKSKPTISPENAKKVEEEFRKVDKMFEFFTRMKDDMSMHEDAVALNSIGLKNSVAQVISLQNQ